ncbi:MAG: rRNA adenine N(6)-methyltransferase family protein [Acidimicrobiales bacterium]
MPARRRTPRDERRRSLGQNFLSPRLADRLIEQAGVRAGELVVELGPGAGALTMALARQGADVLAIEIDPAWADRLRLRAAGVAPGRVRVVTADFFSCRLPDQPFRVVGCVPFGVTTDICRRLFDDPRSPLWRADLIVQWEVALKRAQSPPATLVSTLWAPWWEFELGWRIPAQQFRPVPRVDGGVLIARRRQQPVLPVQMARPYQDFVQAHWPFG